MADEREKSKTLRPLRALAPFLAPYRLMVFAALAALVTTAGLSLVLPLAVRRVIDGFSAESAALMDQYFGAAIMIAGALALATAVRFWLVTRLGERVIADIRRAVYDRVIAMSPGFFETVLTGEVISRLTTDTTLILSVISSSVSVALRNVLLFVGGMALMIWTAPKLAGYTLLIVPMVVLPILILGRRRIIEDMADIRNVEPARSNIGRDQKLQVALAESVQRVHAGALWQVAMNRRSAEAMLLQ